MGIRTDKGKAITRYLTGHTGIPALSWNGGLGGVDAPPPYSIDVTTSRKLENWHELIRNGKPDGIGISIRYDMGMPSLEEAWVGMQLRSFIPLLTAHYESIRPRVQTYLEGE